MVSLRNTDPRALLLVATGTAFCFSIIQNIAILCASLALATVFAAACGPAWRLLLKRLLVTNFFILFIWLTVPWTIPGIPIFSIGSIDISREGSILATCITLRCNIILLVYITLISDMDTSLIGHALERSYIPSKLVFLFFFTCRYIHVIADEWKKLQTAAILRGFIVCSSLHTYRTIGNMLGLTIINSIERSHKIHEAMLLRGFTGHFHTVTELKAERRDVVFVSAFFLFLICLLSADIYLTYHHV